jgi:hypothetical protein
MRCPPLMDIAAFQRLLDKQHDELVPGIAVN